MNEYPKYHGQASHKCDKYRKCPSAHPSPQGAPSFSNYRHYHDLTSLSCGQTLNSSDSTLKKITSAALLILEAFTSTRTLYQMKRSSFCSLKMARSGLSPTYSSHYRRPPYNIGSPCSRWPPGRTHFPPKLICSCL